MALSGVRIGISTWTGALFLSTRSFHLLLVYLKRVYSSFTHKKHLEEEA